MNIASRWLLILTLLVVPLINVQPAAAQKGGSLLVENPVADRFPVISFGLDAYDANGDLIENISRENLEITENGKIIHPQLVRPISNGLQIILALNTSPAMGVQTNGVSEYQRIGKALQDWASGLPAQGLDDFSLATPTGLFVIRARETGQLVEALAGLPADLTNTQPSLNSIAEALDLATDPLGSPNMKRSILYITPPLPGNSATSLNDLALRAKDLGVRVNIWLVEDAAAVNGAEASDPLRNLAETTGGDFYQISPATPLPDVEAHFRPLRQSYLVEYQSAIQESGSHRMSVAYHSGADSLVSQERSLELDIQAPNPIFLSPPESIQRSWTVAEKDLPPSLTPEEVTLQILVEYPDQHPRALKATRLYVNGELVDENTAEPFDQFSWPVVNLTIPGRQMLRVEAVDILDLAGSSIEVPVEVLIDQPVKTSLFSRVSGSGMVAIAAMLISGIALALVLVLTGNQRRGRWKRQQVDKKLMNDPVTQPVKVKPIPERKDRSKPRKERETGSRLPAISLLSRSPSQNAPARLIALDENEQPITGGNIPLGRQEITFGSDPRRATQVLNSLTVDGLHARLYRNAEGGFILSDQNSIAGIWINYAPVDSNGATLRHGDLLHMGKVVFRFELTDPSQVPAAEVKVVSLEL